MYRAISVALILGGVLIYTGWTVVVASNTVSGDTLSEVLRLWGLGFPVIPLIWGSLGGHWWGGFQFMDITPTDEVKITLWVFWIGLIASIAFYKAGLRLEPLGAFILVNLGFIMSSLTWSQAN